MSGGVGSFIFIIGYIALGYVLKKIRRLPSETPDVIAAMVMNLTLPAVVLRTFLTTPFRSEYLFLPLLTLSFGSFMFILAGILPGRDRILFRLSLPGYNLGLFAYPIIQGLFGSEALVPAVYLDLGNALVLFCLNYGWAVNRSRPQGSPVALGPVFRKIFTSVPLISYIAAASLSAAGVTPPETVLTFLAVPASANTILVLILLGFLLDFRFTPSEALFVLRITLFRFLPGLAMSLVCFLFYPGSEELKQILFLIFLMPPGFVVLAYSIELGFDRHLAAKVLNGANLFTMIVILVLVYSFF